MPRDPGVQDVQQPRFRSLIARPPRADLSHDGAAAQVSKGLRTTAKPAQDAGLAGAVGSAVRADGDGAPEGLLEGVLADPQRGGLVHAPQPLTDAEGQRGAGVAPPAELVGAPGELVGDEQEQVADDARIQRAVRRAQDGAAGEARDAVAARGDGHARQQAGRAEQRRVQVPHQLGLDQQPLLARVREVHGRPHVEELGERLEGLARDVVERAGAAVDDGRVMAAVAATATPAGHDGLFSGCGMRLCLEGQSEQPLLVFRGTTVKKSVTISRFAFVVMASCLPPSKRASNSMIYTLLQSSRDAVEMAKSSPWRWQLL